MNEILFVILSRTHYSYRCCRLLIVTLFLLVTAVKGAFAFDALQTALNLHQSSQYGKALPLFIDLARKFKTSNDATNYALCQLKIADIIRNYGGLNLSIELLDENEEYMEVRLEKPTVLLAQNYLAKAEAYYSLSRLSEFKENVFKSIAIKRGLRLADKDFAEDYLHLARYYKEFRNQTDSCSYWMMKSLKLAKSDEARFIYLLPRIYNLIGYYYHPASLSYFINKRDSVIRHFILSRKYYDSALRYLAKVPVEDKIMLGKIYHNLGNSFNNEMGLDQRKELMIKAMTYYKKSRLINTELGSPSDIALKDWVIGRGYERLHLYDSAVMQFQKGIVILIPDFNPANKEALPALQPTLNDIRFISLISIKANNLYALSSVTHDRKQLLSAFEHYEYLLKFHRYLLARSLSENDAINWSELYGTNAYQSLIRTAYELTELTGDKSYLQRSYALIASSKYAWLNKNDLAPLAGSSLNGYVLSEELKLVRNQILKSNPLLSASSLPFLQLKLPANENTSSGQIKLVNDLQENFSIEQLQALLGNEQAALIDYYIRGQELYAVVSTKDSYNVIKQQLPADFSATLWKMNRNLLHYAPNEFAIHSNQIFKELLDSVLVKIPVDVNRIIICPDQQLQNIPWEALVTDTVRATSFRELSYLLKKFVIREVLTPNHLVKVSAKGNGFVGVAPDFTGSAKFTAIPFSTSLVKMKSEQYNGSVVTTFSHDSSLVDVVHIASHVVNDSLRPYRSAIYFNDTDSVTIAELSLWKIRPRLAILNGCHTGTGTYYQAEGTISFARAFYRMGAESVLMTLWNVDDKTTADLLNEFYNETEKGAPLDVSLHKSKMSFIEGTPSDELANPYYWAGLQLSGKADPIKENNKVLLLISAVVAIAILLCFIYVLSKKKSKVNH